MPPRARRALAATVERLEQTLSLLGPLSVIAQPHNLESGSIAVLSHDDQGGGLLQDALTLPIPLRNVDNQVDLILYLSISYRMLSEARTRSSMLVHQTGYIYRICDCSGRPLLEFHYHPTGRSWHTGFHAHSPRSSSARLHVLGRPSDQTREIFGHKLHIPTKEMHAEDLVELLRDDFRVRLTDSNKQRVDRLLTANRAARSTTD